MRRLTKPLLLILAVLLFQSPAWAVEIATAVGLGADSYIWSSQADDNFGSEGTIAIKNDLGTGFVNRKGYVRFDLGSVTAPIPDAVLELTFVEQGASGASSNVYNVFGLNDGVIDAWDEMTITWNNAPANDGSANGVDSASAAFLGTFSFNAASTAPGEVVSFASSELVSFLQEDTNDLVTLIITRGTRSLGNEHFASKENGVFTAPTLRLVPEPTTALLVACGLVGLAATGRKRPTA